MKLHLYVKMLLDLLEYAFPLGISLVYELLYPRYMKYIGGI